MFHNRFSCLVKKSYFEFEIKRPLRSSLRIYTEKCFNKFVSKVTILYTCGIIIIISIFFFCFYFFYIFRLKGNDTISSNSTLNNMKVIILQRGILYFRCFCRQTLETSSLSTRTCISYYGTRDFERIDRGSERCTGILCVC